MGLQCLLSALFIIVGLLFQLNEAFVYREPKIRRLIRAAGPAIRRNQQNARLQNNPTDSDSTDALSDEAYTAQMTIEPKETIEEIDLFFASSSVVEDTTNVMLETSAMDVPPPPMQGQVTKKEKEPPLLTRRAWLQTGVFVGVGTVITSASILNERGAKSKKPPAKFQPLVSPLATANSTAAKNAATKANKAPLQSAATPQNTNGLPANTAATPKTNAAPAAKTATTTPPKTATTSPLKPTTTTTTTPPKTNTSSFPEVPKVEPLKKLEPVNITQVAAETTVNVTLSCQDACVSIDPTTMTKVQSKKVPKWVPSWLAPRPKVIKQISNAELMAAATIAGSFVDVGRTSLLYPIQTVKTRIQTDTFNGTRTAMPIQERMRTFGANVRRHVDEGKLYSGIRPSLLVSVPATGIYYGVRDVSKNVLAMMPLNGIQIALLAALIADIVSLCFRAPADTLRVRLQSNVENEEVGDWFGDALRNLPAIIITDLPYLLTKISLNRALIHGSVSIDQYTEYAIIASSVAALLTTPFDVARTRILVDSDGDFSNGIDGGSGEGVLKTMRAIVKEGNGGYANLFAGWFERVLYLGLGRAWLEPIQLIGYVGIRDAVLLEWF